MTTIMLDARHLGAAQSGIGRYTLRLLDGLAEVRPEARFRLLVRRPGDEAAVERATRPRVEAVRHFDVWPYGLRSAFVVPLALGRRPAELFHSVYHVIPPGLRCATVMTVHDLIPLLGAAGSRFPFPVWCAEYAYFLAAIPESLRRAGRIIAISEATAGELVRRYPFCEPKLRVVRHGVEPRFQPPADRSAALRRAAALTGSDAPYVLCLGGLSPNKNQAGMLRAFAAARSADPAARFVVVARYGDGRPLERLARELGIERRLVVLPHVSEDDLVVLLGAARFLAFCSRVEGFGLPLLEAMACGCPALTSNRSSMPEVGGDAALYADPDVVEDMARHMRRLLAEPSLRGELSQRGRERAATFRWRTTAERTAEIYDEALALRGT